MPGVSCLVPADLTDHLLSLTESQIPHPSLPLGCPLSIIRSTKGRSRDDTEPASQPFLRIGQISEIYSRKLVRATMTAGSVACDDAPVRFSMRATYASGRTGALFCRPGVRLSPLGWFWRPPALIVVFQKLGYGKLSISYPFIASCSDSEIPIRSHDMSILTSINLSRAAVGWWHESI